jgi:hypothetical protein
VAQVVGAVQIKSCKSCRMKQGPWKDCVVVDGFLVGACANCHYGGKGVRCSLRPHRPCKFIHFWASSFIFRWISKLTLLLLAKTIAGAGAATTTENKLEVPTHNVELVKSPPYLSLNQN